MVGELLASQPLAVLATHSDAGPYASLVAFAATDDLRHLLFATTRATRKFANLTADSRVAFLVDNRSNQESDFHEAVAATIMGSAEEVRSADRERLLGVYLGKHPHLREFVTSPTCAFFSVEVRTYYVVTRFQEVVELRIAP
jgi:nitroimidazol reductase NimA-like FMN-containing flavoprotein (pyridoxamine 5'-phosphate oxidase superfamily)